MKNILSFFLLILASFVAACSIGACDNYSGSTDDGTPDADNPSKATDNEDTDAIEEESRVPQVLRIATGTPPSEAAPRIREVLGTLDDTQLVLFGEDHRNVEGKSMVSQLVTEIFSEADRKCHFLESESTYQPAYDLLPEDEQEAADLHRGIFDEKAPAFAERFGRQPSYWTDFANLGLIARAGYRVIAAEDAMGDEFWDEGQHSFYAWHRGKPP